MEAGVSSGGKGRRDSRGAVIDIAFATGVLPPIDDALSIEDEDGRKVMAEVQAHLTSTPCAAIALQATAGLRAATPVRATGGPITRAGRRRGARAAARRDRRHCATTARPFPTTCRAGRSIARRRRFAAQSAATDVFDTGIKVIDLLAPLAQGGKAAMFGGAGVGKTVLVMELIHAMVAALSGHLGLRRHRRALARGPRAAAGDAQLRRARPHRAGLRPDERAARRALAGAD